MIFYSMWRFLFYSVCMYVSFLLHQMRCEAYSLWLYRRKTIDDAVIRFAQTSTLTKTVNFNDEFIR